jgi:predicted PurR-regulated permease PerM
MWPSGAPALGGFDVTARSEKAFWLVLAGLVVAGLLLYLLAPILTPFLIAALFAYLGDPLADRLQGWGASRTLAVVVVFAGMLTLLALALLVLVPVLEDQLATLIAKIPGYLQWMNEVVLPGLGGLLGIELARPDPAMLKEVLGGHWQQAGGAVAGVLGYVSRSGTALIAWLANLLLIPVIGFYLLRDWDGLVANVQDLLPRSVEPTVALLARQSDEVLGAFIRGQLLVMLALGTIYSLGLWLIGLEFALLVGMLAGLVSFVPYLGFIVGILVAGVAILVQTQDPLQLLWVAAVFGVGQLLEGTVLTPVLVGDRIGLHPVAVIFAVLAGAQLFGFFGVLLALPVAAVLAVLLRHAHRGYVGSAFYGPPRPQEPE